MKQHQINPEVDAYTGNLKQWREETEQLRAVLLDCALTEELKWGKPCYTSEGKNIVIIQPFKDYFALLFFKGVLLKDPDHILVKTGPNTEVGRQVRFANVAEIIKQAPLLKKYVRQAIEIERSGLSARPGKPALRELPEELQQRLDQDPAYKKAFEKLTPGRQNAYSFYFSSAKQPKTRESRIDQCRQQILDGKGLND